MTRSIVITSGKGGVGKTTLTANLGRCLGMMGYRVLLIDTDVGLNNLDVTLNIEKKIVFDIVDVLQNRCRLKQALVEDVVKGVFILPSCHSYDTSRISSLSLKHLTEMLIGFDFCLLDCPAGIDQGFHRAVSACSEALVVTTPHLSALKDADKVLAILKSYKIKSMLALNRVRGDLIVSADMVSPQQIKSALNVPVVGVIPENDEMSIFSNTGKLLSKSNQAFKASMMLAKNIVYGNEALYDATKYFKGFFGRMRRRARRQK